MKLQCELLRFGFSKSARCAYSSHIYADMHKYCITLLKTVNVVFYSRKRIQWELLVYLYIAPKNI